MNSCKLSGLFIFAPNPNYPGRCCDEYYYDCKEKSYIKNPKWDDLISEKITCEEFKEYTKTLTENNCYYCSFTKNDDTRRGHLLCDCETSKLFNDIVTNLNICDNFEKIKEECC